MTSPTPRTPQEILARLTALLAQGNLQNNLAEIQQLQTLLTQLALGGATAQGDGATAVAERGVYAGGNARDINTGIMFVNNQYAGPDPKDDREAAKRIYLDALSYTVSYLPLGAFDANESNPKAGSRRMQLDDVFIRLDTTKQVRKEPNEKEPTTLVGRIRRKLTQVVNNVRGESSDRLGVGEKDMRPLRAMEAAAHNPALVITGEPGSGKSTFVNFLLHCLARTCAGVATDLPEQFSDDWPGNQRDLVPVRVILRDFEVWLREQPAHEVGPNLLRGFITHTLRQQNLLFADSWIGAQIEAGQALLVLDGLDEVTTIQTRLRVRDAIQDFETRHRRNRYLITCRTLAYQAPERPEAADLRLNTNDFPIFELADLDDEKIQDFVEAWHTELARTGKFNQQRADDLQSKLWTALQATDLKSLSRNPLQLTLMAWVHTDNDELPDKRARLYDKAIELLLWKWELQKQYRDKRETLGELALKISGGRRAIELVLRRMAYEAHQALPDGGMIEDGKATDALADVDEAKLQKALANLKRDLVTDKCDENWARDVVDAIKERSGLLARRGENTLTFPHRTFQEFLAGLHMLGEADFVDLAIQKSTQLTLWREPILLAVGYSVFKQDRTDLALPLTLPTANCIGGGCGWRVR